METEKKRALAHIEKIAWIKPIENADNIELVGVLGWQCIAKKGEFEVGSPCVYIEIDSMVPEWNEFEFLKSRKYKIKTIRFSKFKDEYGTAVISQGIAIPVSTFAGINEVVNGNEGDDVTDVLKVTYYDPEDRQRKADRVPSKYDAMKQRNKNVFGKPWVKKMMHYKWFRRIMFLLYGRKKDKPFKFPSWISITDEDRIELFPQYLLDYETEWLMTEKIDGTSTTFAAEKKRFGKWEFIVCSRKVRMRTPNQKCWHDENVYWQMAEKYNMQDAIVKVAKSLSKNGVKINKIIVQGETYGYKLQGNPYKMHDVDFKAFNLIVFGKDSEGNFRKKYNTNDMVTYLTPVGVPCVPILGTFKFYDGCNMHNFKLMADGTSQIADVLREGIVYRNINNPDQSFKSVSNEYLLSRKK